MREEMDELRAQAARLRGQLAEMAADGVAYASDGGEAEAETAAAAARALAERRADTDAALPRVRRFLCGPRVAGRRR